MSFSANKTLLMIVVLCFFFIEAQAQRLSLRDEIEREIVLTLFEKDLTMFANQLANEKTTTTKRLIFKLNVFARAGHRARVHQTLNQLAEAKDFLSLCSSDYYIGSLIHDSISQDDLTGWKIYYEKLIKPDSVPSPENFITLWEKEGDVKELESWLTAQSKKVPLWQHYLINLKIKLGKADEILSELAADVRNNPKEVRYAFIYLKANEQAKNLKDVSWLENFYEYDTAYDNYNLGRAFLHTGHHARIASKYLEKSLSLPFTKEDEAKIPKYHISSGESRAINYEKQLRFWTKQELAKCYNATGEFHLAQPIVEELVKMKDDKDIYAEDAYMAAGATQSGSGFRVVESKILNEEEAKKTSVQYWFERTLYYRGRKEYDTVVNTYHQALSNFPYKPQSNDLYKRLDLIRGFIGFMTGYNEAWEKTSEERQNELQKFLRAELSSVPQGSDYALELADIIFDEDGLDDFCISFFIREEKTALSHLITGRDNRLSDEMDIIWKLVDDDDVTSEEKDFVLSQVDRFLKDPASSRTYKFASLMVEHKPKRAIPLLTGFFRTMREKKENEDYPTREEAATRLLEAYLRDANWKEAEKFLFANKELLWRTTVWSVNWMASIAAKSGAIEDGVRIWKININLDRRKTSWLSSMAETKAKEYLREYYSQMKKDDALSTSPDEALRLLK